LDNVRGNDANNTIDASRVISAGTGFDTLSSSDSVDALGGTDTLFVQAVTAAATSIAPTSIKNVEILTVENIGANAYTLSLANADTSIKTLNIQNSTTAAGTVSITNNPTTFTTVGLSNVGSAVVVSSATAAVAGTADTLAVNLASVTGAQGVSVAGYETVNLSSGGSVANSIGTLTDSSLTTLNISGASDLTLVGAATSLALSTVNAGTATGRVSLTLDAAQTQAITFTGGSAADTINMGGTYTSTDVLNGGAGTDILTLTNAEAVAATTAQTNVTLFETLTLSSVLNGSINAANFGVNTVNLASATTAGGASAISFIAGTNTVGLSSSTGNTSLTLNVAGTATTDVLNINAGNVIIQNVKIYDVRGRLIHEQNNINASTTVFNNLSAEQQVLLVKITLPAISKTSTCLILFAAVTVTSPFEGLGYTETWLTCSLVFTPSASQFPTCN
jgi:hypothetical protein